METARAKVTAADIFLRKQAREPGAGGRTERRASTNGKAGENGGGRKIAAVTAYDYTFARLVDAAGVDVILVGDSLGMVMMGLPNTVGVGMEAMLHHTLS
ncbi:MAG: 3-methyl-2-oxobutanoate hydroxymethyltransferase, partial [Nitrospinota bacterium]|nr:3-methyl-2-oxobutanoate hydroxymethyltransferase [Nitrospinota bacterium]